MALGYNKMSDRVRVLKAIKKCLSDALSYFQETMDILDEIGKPSASEQIGSVLVGGFFFKDKKQDYAKGLIKLDAAEKALEPLAIRFRDGRVNSSHFKDDDAVSLLNDVIDYEYQLLINLLAERKGRETVWYRLKELSDKIQSIIDLIAET
jgi:hypothetical protein